MRDIHGIEYSGVVSKRSQTETLLAAANNKYDKFSKMKDESLKLSQELRQIASRILKLSPNSDECPLCHTRFKPGELKKHINIGLDEHLELQDQRLLSDLRDHKSELVKREAIVDALAWLNDFREKADLASDVSVRSALDEVDKVKRDIDKAQRSLDKLNQKIVSLESRGQTLSRLDEILDLLSELEYPLKQLNAEAVTQLSDRLKHDSKHSINNLNANRKQISRLQKRIKSYHDFEISDIRGIKNEFSKLKEKLTKTESIQDNLIDFFIKFPWPKEKPLGRLMVQTNSVRNVALEFNSSLAKERKAESLLVESVERKKLLEERVEKLTARIKRFREAASSLKKLQKEHSLKSAVESALKQNRGSIEAIFKRIHSPAEFKELGSSWTKLVRMVDASEASLSEISTGQRSAFALSIFLAQNFQLKLEAPPVVLIDDPIAHVDDLNALSFLDYLRDVVLAGDRQVFFSTANKKLATLLERKFDFLGEIDFKRINLTRKESIGN